MKKSIIAIVLAVATLVTFIVPASAWSWKDDAQFEVAQHNAPIVEDGAIVKNSVIFSGAVIKKGAIVENSIIDENVVIEEKAVVGEINDEKSIAVVGRSAVIPAGTKVAKGEIIDGTI